MNRELPMNSEPAFEWDADKDRANRAKHGINFEEVLSIFDGHPHKH